LLAGFRVGIGIGSGIAIAGKIGTDEQVKVGVFGPVVNLTSRLQGMTRFFDVPILVDQRTAECVERSLPRQEGSCRALGRVRPKGLDGSVLVSELFPTVGPDAPLSETEVAGHNAAVEAFLRGDWAAARRLFTSQSNRDTARDFLLDFMARTQFVPPPDWDGVISLSEK
jgi:adenylate cyclase